MKVYGRNHVYNCIPPYLDNAKLPPEEQVQIGLKIMSAPEQDAWTREREKIFATYATEKARIKADESFVAKVREKFNYCKGLVIEGVNDDGRELTFDELYEDGPPELVEWMFIAVTKGEILTLAERKN